MATAYVRLPTTAPEELPRASWPRCASLAGEVLKGGGSKVNASRAVDGYLGVGEFAGDLNASTGFACDRNLAVRGRPAAALVMRKRVRMPGCMPLQVMDELRVGEQAWENSGINGAFKAVDAVQRKVAPALKRAQQFGAHSTHAPRAPLAQASRRVALTHPAAAVAQGYEHGTH